MSDREAAALAIDVRGLNKHFGDKHVVRDVALQVKRGEIFGFLGPNGSGKTTTIRMLCGLLTPDSGSGTCLGFDILRESEQIKREVGYMTQRFSYWDDLSIRENLDFVARLYQVREREQVVTKSLEDLGLAQRADQLAGTLSGGWKQRLALAACLLHEPQLLLLDEPTAGVDPGARRDFWEELHRLAARGISVLVSTHYMDEAERCHRLAYIASGSLLAQGTADEITNSLKLATFCLTGPGLAGLADKLLGQPGVEQTVAFGSAVHVSGTDADALKATLERVAAERGLKVEPIRTSLEHAFIYLMKRAPKENGHA
ncbi:ABC transporter ATP-binding protein [Massilia terrae]|uniref:ABC transporter ATP-binding protein n=1 Tax=Massilia terrae TaxID=1811224 RepID=A0ABT2CSZ2_9BURK|nr:ABC transporter ATP-binding protein [Massilia terrae]MCS0656890.1 ABC transporter ATP-binding protein [Massilia terrae]